MNRAELNKLVKDFEKKGGKIKKLGTAYPTSWTPFDIYTSNEARPRMSYVHADGTRPRPWLREE